MKRLSCWLSSLCLATMCACVGDAGIYTLSSHPLDENCLCDSTVIRPSGTLDVSAQELFQDSSYHLGILLQNDLDGEDTDTVGAQRNLFYLRQIVLETRIGNSTVSEEMDVSGSCSPGGGQLLGVFDIVSPKAFQKMSQLASADLQTAVVIIRFKGKLLSGDDYTTNAYDFPINFYASGVTPTLKCGDGEVLQIYSSSGCSLDSLIGQDGAFSECIPEEDAEST